jgi:hypothetical protein
MNQYKATFYDMSGKDDWRLPVGDFEPIPHLDELAFDVEVGGLLQCWLSAGFLYCVHPSSSAQVRILVTPQHGEPFVASYLYVSGHSTTLSLVGAAPIAAQRGGHVTIQAQWQCTSSMFWSVSGPNRLVLSAQLIEMLSAAH